MIEYFSDTTQCKTTDSETRKGWFVVSRLSVERDVTAGHPAGTARALTLKFNLWSWRAWHSMAESSIMIALIQPVLLARLELITDVRFIAPVAGPRDSHRAVRRNKHVLVIAKLL